MTLEKLTLINNLHQRHQSLKISDVLFTKTLGLSISSYREIRIGKSKTIVAQKMKLFEKLNQLTNPQLLKYTGIEAKLNEREKKEEDENSNKLDQNSDDEENDSDSQGEFLLFNEF